MVSYMKNLTGHILADYVANYHASLEFETRFWFFAFGTDFFFALRVATASKNEIIYILFNQKILHDS